MEEIKKRFEEIKKNKKFKDYTKENPKSYLSGMFLNEGKWEFDFYCPEKHKITTFSLDQNDVVVKPAEKIFQKEEKVIHKIDLDKIKINLDMALDIVDELFEKKGVSEQINKKIIILQNIDGNEVWNITYLTSCFNIMNVKIDAVSGKIVHENFESILNLRVK